MLQTSRLVIYRPVQKIQTGHVTNLMTLKALSILYFYLCPDFEAFDTMFLWCFPWICKLHVLVCKFSQSFVGSMKRAGLSLCYVSSLFYVLSLKVNPSSCFY